MSAATDTSRARAKRILAALLLCVVIVAAVAYANAVIKPGRKGNAGGATWRSYLSQRPRSLDVVFFGTSHAFSSIDPSSLWRAGGIPSFVLAGPMQPTSVTEYYVREALRTQRPRVMVLEMAGASYDAARFNRDFHKMNIGYMPWGPNRVAAAVFASPAGEKLGALLDLWTLHGREDRFTLRDFDIAGKDAGYEFLKGFKPSFPHKEVTATPYAQTPAARTEADAEIATNLPALRRIAQVAKDNNVELVLLLTPTSPPGGYTYHLQRSAAALQADFPDVRTLDLSQPGAVPGLSYDTDFLDGGHLTYKGAEKVAPVLAKFLATTYGLPDRGSDPAYASWAADVAARDRYMAGRVPKK